MSPGDWDALPVPIVEQAPDAIFADGASRPTPAAGCWARRRVGDHVRDLDEVEVTGDHVRERDDMRRYAS